MTAANRPRLLDLFCGAGGAAMGYHRAGFDVVGVDNRPQSHYPFEFHQGDALDVLESIAVGGFWLGEIGMPDAIHASPPCQRWAASSHYRAEHPDLIGATQTWLDAFPDVPWVIENVPRSPLRSPVMICGSSLGLRVRRHRLFESNVPLMVPTCIHHHQGRPVGVYGSTGGRPTMRHHLATTADGYREVMGMPWASAKECTQAIPPAYTELIGHQLLAHIQAVAA